VRSAEPIENKCPCDPEVSTCFSLGWIHGAEYPSTIYVGREKYRGGRASRGENKREGIIMCQRDFPIKFLCFLLLSSWVVKEEKSLHDLKIAKKSTSNDIFFSSYSHKEGGKSKEKPRHNIRKVLY